MFFLNYKTSCNVHVQWSKKTLHVLVQSKVYWNLVFSNCTHYSTFCSRFFTPRPTEVNNESLMTKYRSINAEKISNRTHFGILASSPATSTPSRLPSSSDWGVVAPGGGVMLLLLPRRVGRFLALPFSRLPFPPFPSLSLPVGNVHVHVHIGTTRHMNA